MKKKLLSTLLCATMAASLLAGCAGKAGDSSSASSATTGKEAQKVTISLGIWPDSSLPDDVKLFEGYVKTFNEKHANVTVKPASYTYATDTFIPLCEAGNCPTLYDTWFTEPQKIIKGGYAADITDILKERGWLDSMNPAVKKLLSDADGKVYGVPRDAYALGLMMNADLFKKAGLVDADGYPQYPTTWDDFAKKAKTIKDKTGAAGFCLLAKDNAAGWQFTPIAWSFGATFTTANSDGTYTANVDSKEAIKAMEFIKSLKWEYDVLTADPLSEDWGTGFTALASGDAAMYIAANDAVNQPTQVNGLPLESLAMCGLPAGPAGQFSLTGGTPYMFAADATKDQINAALDFLEVMGRAPVASESVKAGLESSAKNNVTNGVPVISGFPCWVNDDYLKMVKDVVAANSNVDAKMYQPYFDAVEKGTLKTEEAGSAQDLYAELTKVIQEVITNKDADVTALMKTADKNYQAKLDELYAKK